MESKLFLQNLQQISCLLQKCFGPDGKGIMIVRECPREMCITKHGSQILSEYKNSSDHLTKLAVEISLRHSEHLGDGSKRIFIATETFINKLLKMRKRESESWRMEVVQELMHAKQILAFYKNKQVQSCKTVRRNRSDFVEDVCKTVNSGLATRFPQSISRTLSGLAKEFLLKNLEQNENEDSTENYATQLKSFIHRFPLLVYQEQSRPVSTGRVIPGLVFSLGSAGLPYSWKDGVSGNLVILSRSENQDEIVLEIDSSKIEDVELRELQVQRRIAEELKWKDVKLVLCEQTISTLLKQCLELVGIQAIQDIGHSEVLILSDILGIVPWDADDNLLASSCLIPVTANIIDLGGRDVGVNLTGPEISCSTMIISAPNQTLANQYSSSIKGLLKTSELLSEENFSDDCSIQQLNKLSVDNNCAALSNLSKSLQFGVPELSQHGRPSEPRPVVPGESKLTWLIADAVLDITHQIARISGVYTSRKRIAQLNLNQNRISKQDSDSDSDD